MSGTYGITTGKVALAANTTTYLFGVVSGSATVDGVLTRLHVTMDSAAPATGVLLELFRATGGIPTGTAFVGQNGSGVPNNLSQASRTNSQMASAWVAPMTVTPTGLTVIEAWLYSPMAGGKDDDPLSREFYMPAGTTNWFGLRATTPAGVAPNCLANARWAE